MSKEIEKKAPLEIERVHKKMELLDKLLSKNDKQKLHEKIKQWWEKLPTLWHDIFLINLHYARNMSQAKIRKIMQLNENPYFRFNHFFGKFDRQNFQIDQQTLEEIYNLRSIDCQSFRIAGIEPLSFLPNLEYLDASHNPITSIEPLRGKQTLIKLDINSTQVSDIDALKTLTNLEFLWIYAIPHKLEMSFLPRLKILLATIENLNNPEILPLLPELEILLANGIQTLKIISNFSFPNLKTITFYGIYNINNALSDTDEEEEKLIEKFLNNNPDVTFSGYNLSYIEKNYYPEYFEGTD